MSTEKRQINFTSKNSFPAALTENILTIPEYDKIVKTDESQTYPTSLGKLPFIRVPVQLGEEVSGLHHGTLCTLYVRFTVTLTRRHVTLV